MKFQRPVAPMSTRSHRTLFATRATSAQRLRHALWWTLLAAGALVWLGFPLDAQAVRIKEIAAVQGVRSNQLTGYGLVVGLDGTGDQTTQTPFTTQSMLAMLQQLGITVPAGTNMQLRNVAAVLVTATLPPFAQPGQALDVAVSSVGNAKSLRGGTLIASPLRGRWLGLFVALVVLVAIAVLHLPLVPTLLVLAPASILLHWWRTP